MIVEVSAQRDERFGTIVSREEVIIFVVPTRTNTQKTAEAGGRHGPRSPGQRIWYATYVQERSVKVKPKTTRKTFSRRSRCGYGFWLVTCGNYPLGMATRTIIIIIIIIIINVIKKCFTLMGKRRRRSMGTMKWVIEHCLNHCWPLVNNRAQSLNG